MKSFFCFFFLSKCLSSSLDSLIPSGLEDKKKTKQKAKKSFLNCPPPPPPPLPPPSSLIHRPIISKVAIIFELQVPIGRIADTTERSWRIRLQTDCTCLAGRSGRIQFPAQEKPVLTTGFYFYFIYQFDSFFLLFICSFFV